MSDVHELEKGFHALPTGPAAGEPEKCSGYRCHTNVDVVAAWQRGNGDTDKQGRESMPLNIVSVTGRNAKLPTATPRQQTVLASFQVLEKWRAAMFPA